MGYKAGLAADFLTLNSFCNYLGFSVPNTIGFFLRAGIFLSI